MNTFLLNIHKYVDSEDGFATLFISLSLLLFSLKIAVLRFATRSNKLSRKHFPNLSQKYADAAFYSTFYAYSVFAIAAIFDKQLSATMAEAVDLALVCTVTGFVKVIYEILDPLS